MLSVFISSLLVSTYWIVQVCPTSGGLRFAKLKLFTDCETTDLEENRNLFFALFLFVQLK